MFVPATAKMARITCLARKLCCSASYNTVGDLYTLQACNALDLTHISFSVYTGNPVVLQESDERQHATGPASLSNDVTELDPGLHTTSSKGTRSGGGAARARAQPSASREHHDTAGSALGDSGTTTYCSFTLAWC